MAQDKGGSTDSGRFVVVGVGIVGLALIVGYGALQSRQRNNANNLQPPPEAASASVLPSVADLTLRAEAARRSLDVQALAGLESELASAAANAAVQPKATAARLELADALAARALEAAIRVSALQGDQADAKRSVEGAIGEAGAILDALEEDGADPGRVSAARARLQLAAGQDATTDHPIVLMPTYRDTELRLAVLARPLWQTAEAVDGLGENDDSGGQDDVEEMVALLRSAQPQTGLVRVLTAIGLKSQGDEEAALSVLDEVLAAAPGQPLALALRAELTGSPVEAQEAPTEPVVGPVAVVAARPPRLDPVAPTPAAAGGKRPPRRTGKARPTPVPVAEPVPAAEPTPAAPEPQPEPARAPEPAPAPEPTPAPEPVIPEPGSVPEPPTKTAPKSSGTKAAKRPKPKRRSYEELLAQGCKLVRGGDAKPGLELLKKAHDLKPGALEVTLCMAEAHNKLGRDASARALVDRVLRKSPRNKRARLLAAKIEIARGNTSGALTHYRVVLDVDPNNAKAKAFVEKHDG